MSNKNAIATLSALQPTTMGEAMQFSEMLAKSSLVPKQFQGKSGDILVAMQMGAELGLSPMQAVQNIAVINGRPSVWGDALLAVVQGRSDFEDIDETNNGSKDAESWAAICIIKRKGRSPVQRSFSVADAKRAGLWGKQGPWTQYPKRMMQMRARGFALRDAYADALRGIWMAEEAQDVPVIREEAVRPKQIEAKTKSERVSAMLDEGPELEPTEKKVEPQESDNPYDYGPPPMDDDEYSFDENGVVR